MPSKESPQRETIHDQLKAKLAVADKEIEEQVLPGWKDLFERNELAQKTVSERRLRVEFAVRDEDEFLFQRSLSEWRAAWDRVNEILAEEYRADNPDPETWQLRYLKWMKIKFIRFSSPLGQFFLVPRPPRKKPKGVAWYTVDEMIAMLHPTTAASIKTFGRLPTRVESLNGPVAGEKHMHIDFTGDETVIRYELAKGPRYGRERIRR